MPADALSIDRFQAYFRRLAHEQRQAVPAPPFMVYLHPQEDLSFFNYAIPLEPDPGPPESLGPALAQLRGVFLAAGRSPRFEFLEAYAPRLPAALQAAGFEEEARQLFMVCTPQDYRPLALPEGFRAQVVAEPQDVGVFLAARRQGFALTGDPDVPPEQAAEFAQAMRRAVMLVAFFGDAPAGTALLDEQHDGLRELNSVSTRPEFRRRGLAAALSAAAAGLGFEQGAQAVCLTAADENAGRVYARCGFRPYATMLAYRAGERSVS